MKNDLLLNGLRAISSPSSTVDGSFGLPDAQDEATRSDEKNAVVSYIMGAYDIQSEEEVCSAIRDSEKIQALLVEDGAKYAHDDNAVVSVPGLPDVQSFSGLEKEEVIVSKAAEITLSNMFTNKGIEKLVTNVLVPESTRIVVTEVPVLYRNTDSGLVNFGINLDENVILGRETRTLIPKDSDEVKKILPNGRFTSGVTYTKISDIMTIKDVPDLDDNAVIDGNVTIQNIAIGEHILFEDINIPFAPTNESYSILKVSSLTNSEITLTTIATKGKETANTVYMNGVPADVMFKAGIKASGDVNLEELSMTINISGLTLLGVPRTSTGTLLTAEQMKEFNKGLLELNGLSKLFNLRAQISAHTLPNTTATVTSGTCQMMHPLSFNRVNTSKQSLLNKNGVNDIFIKAAEITSLKEDFLEIILDSESIIKSQSFSKERHVVKPMILNTGKFNIANAVNSRSSTQLPVDVDTAVGEKIASIGKDLANSSSYTTVHELVTGKPISKLIISAVVHESIEKVLTGSYKKEGLEVNYVKHGLSILKDKVLIYISSDVLLSSSEEGDGFDVLRPIVRKFTTMMHADYISTGAASTAANKIVVDKSSIALGNMLLAVMTVEGFDTLFDTKIAVNQKSV